MRWVVFRVVALSFCPQLGYIIAFQCFVVINRTACVCLSSKLLSTFNVLCSVMLCCKLLFCVQFLWTSTSFAVIVCLHWESLLSSWLICARFNTILVCKFLSSFTAESSFRYCAATKSVLFFTKSAELKFQVLCNVSVIVVFCC